MKYALLVALFAPVLLALARWVRQERLAFPLGECVATMAFASVLTALAAGLAGILEGRHVIAEDQAAGIRIAAMMIALVLTFAGSLWGWSAAARLKVDRPRGRIGLMIAGWMLAAAISGGIVFVLAICALTDRTTPARWVLLLVGGMALPLALPGLAIERLLARGERGPGSPERMRRP